MKFKSTSQVLSQGISAVRNAIGSPLNNPTVENIYISCRDNIVTFIATNLNLTIRYEGEAEVEIPGELVLPSKVIIEVFTDLPEGDVTFDADGDKVFIFCSKFEGKLKGQSAELFPPFMMIEQGDDISFQVDQLKSIIQKTIFATSQEKSRYELDGVKFDLKEKKLTCVATDGRRLAVYEMQDDMFPENELKALVPEKTLQEVMRIFPDEGEVHIRIHERKIQFICGGVTIISNLLMDNFPPYERIIPPAGDIKIVLKRISLASAIKRASHLTNSDLNMVVFLFESGLLNIYGEYEEIGGEAKEQIEADYNGDRIEIRYNYKFLLDFLRALDDEFIEMELRDTRKPTIFRSVGNDRFKYILMPMKHPGEEEG